MNCFEMARETGGARDERIKKARSGRTPIIHLSVGSSVGVFEGHLLLEAFAVYDATGDGSLNIEELRKALKARWVHAYMGRYAQVLGTFSEEEVKKVCADLDKSKAEALWQPTLVWRRMGKYLIRNLRHGHWA